MRSAWAAIAGALRAGGRGFAVDPPRTEQLADAPAGAASAVSFTVTGSPPAPAPDVRRAAP